jgi:hypothetical protein
MGEERLQRGTLNNFSAPTVVPRRRKPRRTATHYYDHHLLHYHVESGLELFPESRSLHLIASFPVSL